MNAARVALAALAMAALGGCAACHVGEEAMVHESLYFGTARPGGVVTQAEWAAFLESTVTPRFPEGLTAWDAAGQWRGGQGDIQREASHVLHIVRPAGERGDKAMQEIVAQYRAKFQQDAVLRVRHTACVSFRERS